jgi:hypothetical protein
MDMYKPLMKLMYLTCMWLLVADRNICVMHNKKGDACWRKKDPTNHAMGFAKRDKIRH